MKPTAKQIAYLAKLMGDEVWDQPETSEEASRLIQGRKQSLDRRSTLGRKRHLRNAQVTTK